MKHWLSLSAIHDETERNISLAFTKDTVLFVLLYINRPRQNKILTFSQLVSQKKKKKKKPYKNTLIARNP